MDQTTYSGHYPKINPFSIIPKVTNCSLTKIIFF
jgi:hypothetical protein